MQTERDQTSNHQAITMTFTAAPNFCQVLQSGVEVDVLAGCSIEHLLCEQWGLDLAYVEAHISTIFLDGKPVDDIHTAMVEEGSTLALSAAMPGLVGATLRKGGFYAQLRSGISHHAQTTCRQHLGPAAITVKLFNVVAEELGPRLLMRGVRLPARHLRAFLESRPAAFWQNCEAATLDGRPLPLAQLRHSTWPQTADWIELRTAMPAQVSG